MVLFATLKTKFIHNNPVSDHNMLELINVVNGLSTLYS